MVSDLSCDLFAESPIQVGFRVEGRSFILSSQFLKASTEPPGA